MDDLHGTPVRYPVAVSLGGLLGDEVAAYVEGEAGWHVVQADGPVRPTLLLAAEVRPQLPTVVVVDAEPTPQAIRAWLEAGALDVVVWPTDRARLLQAPSRIRRERAAPRGPRVLRVAGAAGGVGTSTVALAVAGLVAWSGTATLVVGGDDLVRLCAREPWRGPGASDVAALDEADAGHEVAGLARPVEPVPGLWLLGGGRMVASTAAWPVDLVVLDAGVDLAGAADLVCARPDASLRALGGLPVPVLLVGEGLLDARGVRRLLGRDPVGRLPDSVRVARAGLAARVPADLPGTWLRTLGEVLRRLPPSSA